MGEAKSRGSFDERKHAATEVGPDTLADCYSKIFKVAQDVYKHEGGVNHDLKGVTLKDGKLAGVSVLMVEDNRRVPELIQKMLSKFPVVIHTMEVWHTTKPGVIAEQDPDREDAISFMLHTREAVMTAICPVDVKNRVVTKGELGAVVSMGGDLARSDIATRH